jgi:hypothetical protein
MAAIRVGVGDEPADHDALAIDDDDKATIALKVEDANLTPPVAAREAALLAVAEPLALWLDLDAP